MSFMLPHTPHPLQEGFFGKLLSLWLNYEWKKLVHILRPQNAPRWEKVLNFPDSHEAKQLVIELCCYVHFIPFGCSALIKFKLLAKRQKFPASQWIFDFKLSDPEAEKSDWSENWQKGNSEKGFFS